MKVSFIGPVHITVHFIAVVISVILAILITRSKESVLVRTAALEITFGAIIYQVIFIFILWPTTIANIFMLRHIAMVGACLYAGGTGMIVLYYPQQLSFVKGIHPAKIAFIVHLPVMVLLFLHTSLLTPWPLIEYYWVKNLGWFFFLFVLIGFSYPIMYLVVVLGHLVRSRDPVVKVRSALMVAAVITNIIGGVVDLVLGFTFGFLSNLDWIFFTVASIISGIIGVVGIMKYRMFETQQLFQRGLATTLTSLSIGVIFKLSQEIMETQLHEILPLQRGWVSQLTAVILVGLLVIPIHRISKRISDRLYPRVKGLRGRLTLLEEEGIDTGQLERLLDDVVRLQQNKKRKQARRLMDVVEAQTLVLEASLEDDIPITRVRLGLESDAEDRYAQVPSVGSSFARLRESMGAEE